MIFAEWFEGQTKDKGNNKKFRNRKGMELAWNAAVKECAEYFDKNSERLLAFEMVKILKTED